MDPAIAGECQWTRPTPGAEKQVEKHMHYIIILKIASACSFKSLKSKT